MSFEFTQEHVDSYQRSGFAVFRQILPVSLITDLRRTAEQARAIAHRLHGPQSQRLQPLSSYADDLDLKPVLDYRDLPPLIDAIAQLLSPIHRHGGGSQNPGAIGILFEPADSSYTTAWHRDWRDNIPGCPVEDWESKQHNPEMFNQINCALYEDSSTWIVPGSHARGDLPMEAERFPTRPRGRPSLDAAAADADRERWCLGYCRSMPGALRTHLDAGDLLIYRNTLWHLGNYVPYKRRATLHDSADTPAFAAWREWATQKARENCEAARAQGAATAG